MSTVPQAIMDAAERRIRIGGFHGFSFREIAADVGVKSSTVHYHFPTKEDLAAAVIRRYTQRIEETIDQDPGTKEHPVKAWILRFRKTLHLAEHMCPCAVLGTATRDLSPEVAIEVKHFFKMCHAKMMESGLSPGSADKLLATITGALVVANATYDLDLYDRATSDLIRELEITNLTEDSSPVSQSRASKKNNK